MIYFRLFLIFLANTLLLTEASAQTVTLDKLNIINKHWNSFVKYSEDAPGDHWQSPAESLARRAGDCEDLVLVKMFDPTIMYRYRANEVRLAYVHTTDGTPHMVLLLGLGRDRVVLDNVVDEVKTLAASGYTPVYELDRQGRVYQGGIWQKQHPRFKKLDAILARYQLLDTPLAQTATISPHRS